MTFRCVCVGGGMLALLAITDTSPADLGFWVGLAGAIGTAIGLIIGAIVKWLQARHAMTTEDREWAVGVYQKFLDENTIRIARAESVSERLFKANNDMSAELTQCRVDKERLYGTLRKWRRILQQEGLLSDSDEDLYMPLPKEPKSDGSTGGVG